LANPLAEAKNINLSIADVPDELTILADPDRIARVLQNLITNAIKFSPADSTISLTCQEKDAYIKFGVSDQGVGVPESQKEAIFDHFKQLEKASKPDSDSFGLGLAICKAIVEQHKGKIGVTSEHGKGSTFWFRLPHNAQQNVQSL
jgi:signal transduction histidine kinase